MHHRDAREAVTDAGIANYNSIHAARCPVTTPGLSNQPGLSTTEDLNKVEFQDIWHELCVSHYKGEDTPSYLIRR